MLAIKDINIIEETLTKLSLSEKIHKKELSDSGEGLSTDSASSNEKDLASFKMEMENNLEAINWYDSPLSKMSCIKEAKNFEAECTIYKFNGFFNNTFTKELNELSGLLSETFSYTPKNKLEMSICNLDANKAAKIENMLILGVGQSNGAANYGQYIFKKLKIFNTSLCGYASEFIKEELPKQSPGIILLGAANEVDDILESYHRMQKCENLEKIAIIDNASFDKGITFDNTIFCDNDLTKKISRFFKQVIYLGILGIWFLDIKHPNSLYAEENRKKFLIDLLSVTEKAYGVMKNTTLQAQQISTALLQHEHLFILGKGAGHSVAIQSALLFKRISKIHTEGYCSGAFKHGPIALINPDTKTPFVLIILNDEHFDFMISTLYQVKSRGATVIVVTDCKNKIDETKGDFFIEIPENGLMTALLAFVALEIIAFECALIDKIEALGI